MSTAYEFHPLANIFPMITGKAFAELVEDIRANGLREKIVLFDGKIGDGRNRYKACLKAGVEPLFETYDGDDPLAYVLSANLHRRHLDDGQRSMVAAKIANMKHGGDRRSDQAAKSPDVSQKRAGELLNVPERSVRTAKVVIDHGVPELVDLVEKGDVRVSPASTVAKLPEAEQHEIVEQGPTAVVKAAAEAREPEPVEADGFVASMLDYYGTRDGIRSAISPLIRKALESVAGEAVGSKRDDVIGDLGTALDILESLVGDVVETFDEDVLAEIAEKAA